MDKFDARVSRARETYKPSPGFVDQTMEEVRKHKIHRRRFGLRMWVPAVAGTVALLAIAVILVPKPAPASVADGSKTSLSAKKAAVAPTTTSSTSITDGTDDASLNGDLTSVESSMNQSANDQSDVDSSVNDNQQAINIPTS